MRIRYYISVLAVMLLCFAATAQDISKKQKEKDKLEKEIEFLNRKLGENEKKSRNALNDLSLVRRKVTARRQLVKKSEEEINDLNQKIDAKQAAIGSLQEELRSMGNSYSSLVRTTYKLRDEHLWFMYILTSDDFPQATRRYGYMKRLSAQMNNQATQMLEVRDSLNKEKEEIEGLMTEAQKLKDKRQKDLNSLRKDEKASAAIVNKLKKDKNTYQKQLANKQKQVEALNRQIQKMISNAGKKTSTAVDVKLASEFAANKGKLPWPVSGSVVEQFGQHNHPVYTRVKMPFNNGVTIAVQPGTRAKAVFNGVVQQIVVMPGYNQCVLVQHGNYFTFYCKLKSVAVKTGQKVTTGQVVGTVDTIGGETQMHFQIWKDSVPQNPENWLR